MDTDRVLAHQTVLVQGKRITALGVARRVTIPAGAVRIDGRGKFLIPGLADMHVHLDHPDSAQVEQALFLWLANGVTTIRNMDYGPMDFTPLYRLGGPAVLRLRARAAAGTLDSPQIYTSWAWQEQPVPPTDTSLQQRVTAQIAAYKAAGYDFVKIHDESPTLWRAVLTAAHQVGIPVVGHIPPAISVEEALQAGYRSIEHLDGYVAAMVRGPGSAQSKVDEVYADSLSDSAFLRLLQQQLDTTQIAVLAAATKRVGVWSCPTEELDELSAPDVSEDTLARWPEARYASRDAMKKWKIKMAGHHKADERVVNGPGGTLDVRRRLIKTLQADGAGLLSGSDVGTFVIGAYTIPGFSLHHELAALVKAGLTPYQALVTSTRNVAVYFGTMAESGTIAAGKRADLVLLDGNPLLDIQNTRRIAGVMRAGRWFTRSALDRRLATFVGNYDMPGVHSDSTPDVPSDSTR